jgi:hypothetical protein
MLKQMEANASKKNAEKVVPTPVGNQRYPLAAGELLHCIEKQGASKLPNFSWHLDYGLQATVQRIYRENKSLTRTKARSSHYKILGAPHRKPTFPYPKRSFQDPHFHVSYDFEPYAQEVVN